MGVKSEEGGHYLESCLCALFRETLHMATTPIFRTLLRVVRPIYRQTHYARAVSSPSILERCLVGYHNGECISTHQVQLARALASTWLPHNFYPSLSKALHPSHSHCTIRHYSYGMVTGCAWSITEITM